MKKNNLYKLIVISAFTISLACCSSKKAEEKQLSAESWYEKGEVELALEHYESAAENFSKVYNEHPYSNLAVKAKIMEAFSYYEKQDFDMAIPILDEFIKLHPGNKDVSYAYYLRAMSYYKQISDIEHDQKSTEAAMTAIEELMKRFPGSEHARDVGLKLDLIKDHLAGTEMEIGRFYQHKGDLLAAMQRFNVVVNKYQTTAHVKEALYRLVECNIAFGLIGEAQRNASVLGHNYPASKWYKLSYELMRNATKPSHQ